MDTLAVRRRLEALEGRVNYLYLCTAGVPTAGVGHAVRTSRDALALPWTINGSPAGDAAILVDYAAIMKAPVGRRASFYAPLTRCRLSEAAIDALADTDMDAFARQIAARLPEFSSLPGSVQEGVFDIGFNCGVTGLLKFRQMIAALKRGDYQTAACHSFRPDLAPPGCQAPTCPSLATNALLVGTRNSEIAALILAG